jgi:hypothetical protein
MSPSGYLAKPITLLNQHLRFGTHTAFGRDEVSLFGETMTPNNDVDTQRTTILFDGPEGLDRHAADCGNVARLTEAPQLITWPTMHMTATWGN